MNATPAWNLETARQYVDLVVPNPYPCGGTLTITGVEKVRRLSDRRTMVLSATLLWEGTGNPVLDDKTTCGTFEPGSMLHDQVMAKVQETPVNTGVSAHKHLKRMDAMLSEPRHWREVSIVDPTMAPHEDCALCEAGCSDAHWPESPAVAEDSSISPAQHVAALSMPFHPDRRS